MPISSSPYDVRNLRERLVPVLEKKGRSIRDVDLAAATILYLHKDRKTALEQFKGSKMVGFTGGKSIEEFVQIALIGTVEEVVERVGRLRDAGATSCVLIKVPVNSFGELEEQIQMFVEEVMRWFKV